ncbi:hypothetical protein GUITHDRAFT_154942, partial [Guillardia theta CCMP2712]
MYEEEIIRLRRELLILQQKTEENPRSKALEAELKSKVEDMRRYEQMLLQSQEHTRIAEEEGKDVLDKLTRLQQDNERLQAREKERGRALEELQQKNSSQMSILTSSRLQLEQAVANERQKRASLEKDLGFIYQEIQRRQAELSKRRESKARLLDDLRRGHQSLQEVHKVQEDQVASLAEVMSSLDKINLAITTKIDSFINSSSVRRYEVSSREAYT